MRSLFLIRGQVCFFILHGIAGSYGSVFFCLGFVCPWEVSYALHQLLFSYDTNGASLHFIPIMAGQFTGQQ